MAIEARPARADDAVALREVERDAGQRFREVGLRSVADDEPTSAEVLSGYAEAGRAWVAVEDAGVAVGYVVVDVVDGAAHIEQVSVARAHQGKGVGRMLVGQARLWAGENGLRAVTLTTFSHVPWNMPLYEHLGFRALGDDEIGPELRSLMGREAAHGLDPATRVAMVIGPLPPGPEALGAWRPADLELVAGMFSAAPFRWWVAGGQALELYADRSWRDQSDTDVGICRPDAPALFSWMRGWDLHVASGGQLRSWDGRPLSAEADEDNVWARQGQGAPWSLDVVVGEGDAQAWAYRRDTDVRRPWSEVVLKSPNGLPYLAPEVQLLFKSKAPRPKDDLDAEVVAPILDGSQRAWLAELLPTEHPWQGLLDLAVGA